MRKAFGMAMTFIGVIAACGGNKSESKVAASPEVTTKVCNTVCSKKQQCKTGNDDAECHSSCEHGPIGKRLGVVKPAVIDDLLECMAKTSCATLGECRDKVEQNAQETPKSIEVCKKLDALVARCGGSPRPCNPKIKLVNDHVLDQLMSCMDGGCRSAKSCIDELKESIEG